MWWLGGRRWRGWLSVGDGTGHVVAVVASASPWCGSGPLMCVSWVRAHDGDGDTMGGIVTITVVLRVCTHRALSVLLEPRGCVGDGPCGRWVALTWEVIDNETHGVQRVPYAGSNAVGCVTVPLSHPHRGGQVGCVSAVHMRTVSRVPAPHECPHTHTPEWGGCDGARGRRRPLRVPFAERRHRRRTHPVGLLDSTSGNRACVSRYPHPEW